jgi:phage gp36-like protein
MKNIFLLIIVGLLFSMSLYADQFGKIGIPKPEVKKQAAIPAVISEKGFELIYSKSCGMPITRGTQSLKLPGIAGNNEGDGSPGGFYMYSTLDDFQKRLKDHYQAIYSDDDGVVDESLMTDDLTTAYGVVNASIAVRYQTPVTQSDSLPMLKACQLALASELAWLRPDNNEIPEKIKDAAKNARDMLKDISKGEITLPAAPAESTAGAGGSVIVQAETPVFGRTNMGGF